MATVGDYINHAAAAWAEIRSRKTLDLHPDDADELDRLVQAWAPHDCADPGSWFIGLQIVRDEKAERVGGLHARAVRKALAAVNAASEKAIDDALGLVPITLRIPVERHAELKRASVATGRHILAIMRGRLDAGAMPTACNDCIDHVTECPNPGSRTCGGAR